MVFSSFFDTLFTPFLLLPAVWAVVSISFVLTLVIVMSYKFLTDQQVMRGLKEEINRQFH